MIKLFENKAHHRLCLLGLGLVIFIAPSFNNVGNRPSSIRAVDTGNWPSSFGIGRLATQKEIKAIDIDIMPDGRGLPAGSGSVEKGKIIYALKCAACHGNNGVGGPFAPLVGAVGDTIKAKTIGNYWPYSTTLFDYIRRAMPFTQPGSLSDDEVYSLTAYVLFRNSIIDESKMLNAANLAAITMPAKNLFVNDDRHGGPEIK